MSQEDSKASIKITELENLVQAQLAEIDSLKHTVSLLREELSHNDNKYFEQILGILPFPGNLYWKSVDGVYLGCNENMAKIAGLNSYKEIIGKIDQDLSWRNRAEDLAKNDQLVIKTGCLQTFEETGLTASGKRITVITNKIPIKDENDDIVGIVGTSVDITKQKEQEIQLQESLKQANIANDAKSEFIANMSHDIRTPITGLVGMMQDLLYTAENLRKQLQSDIEIPPEKKTEILEDLIQHTERNNTVMLSSVDELLKLCNEILEVTRLDSGLGKPSPAAFDIRQLVGHNKKLLGSAASYNKLTVEIEVAENVPNYLRGLYSYLSRTLLNLLTNALKFTKEGGITICVHVSNPQASYKKGDTVELIVQVKDTGMGIPADKFDTIFEHFSRLTPAYEGVYKGSGLGLYTVKQYVEAMEGSIAVDSEVGKGTCFTLRLPFTVDDHADASVHDQPSLLADFPEQEPELAETTPSNSNIEASSEYGFKPGILVVEDNKLAGRTVCSALERLGCEVDVVETGLAAVEQVQKRIYNLVLMDVGLPDIDGLEATRRIRLLPEEGYHYIPIVALTGHVTDDKHRDCIKAGMDDVITKPAPPMLLESLFKRFVWEFDEEEAKEAAEPEQPEQQEIATLPAIDWLGCLEKAEQLFGNVDVLKEMLELCATQLKETQKILAEGYQEKDLQKLRAELHKCLGGVVFFKLPRLEQSLLHFQSVIHNESDNEAKFSAAHQQAQEAIEAYYVEWKDLQDKI